MNKAVFLDRDNTIIYDAPYMADPGKVEIMPGVVKALRKFRQAGYMLIIVTNQSGIGRGMFTEEAMLQVHKKLRELFGSKGVSFDDIFYCPHSPEDNCECRKPLPGMLLEAAAKHNIDFAESIMIGDKIADVESGIASGCGNNIWLAYGRKPIEISGREFIIAEDLGEVAEKLLK